MRDSPPYFLHFPIATKRVRFMLDNEMLDPQHSAGLLLPACRARQVEAKGRRLARTEDWAADRRVAGPKKGEDMIYKLKGRKYFRVKFQFKGETIHKCTRATDESRSFDRVEDPL